eukprot:tig00021319_g20256.t1
MLLRKAFHQLSRYTVQRRASKSKNRTALAHFARQEARAALGAWRARLREKARSRAKRERADVHFACMCRRRSMRLLAAYALYRAHCRLSASVTLSVKAARSLVSPHDGAGRGAGSAELERFARRQKDGRVATFAAHLAAKQLANERAIAQLSVASARSALRRLFRYMLARRARRTQLAEGLKALELFRGRLVLSMWRNAASGVRAERARTEQARAVLLSRRIMRILFRWHKWAYERKQSARRKFIANAKYRRSLAASSFRQWRRFVSSRVLCAKRYSELTAARRSRGVRNVLRAWYQLYRSLKVERLAAAHIRTLEVGRAWKGWRRYVDGRLHKRAQMARAIGARRRRLKTVALRAWKAAIEIWRQKAAKLAKAQICWQKHAHRSVLRSWKVSLTASRKKAVTYQRVQAHFSVVRQQQILRAWRRVACEQRDMRARVDAHVRKVLQNQAREVFRALHKTAHRQSLRRKALSETVRRVRGRCVRRVFAAWRLWAAARRRALHLSRRVAAREFRGRIASAFDAWRDYVDVRRWKRSRLAVADRFHRRGLARFVLAAWRLFVALAADSRDLKKRAAAHYRRATFVKTLRGWRLAAVREREVRRRLEERHGARTTRGLTSSIRAMASHARARRLKRVLQERADTHFRRGRLHLVLAAWKARARGWAWKRGATVLANDLRARRARGRSWAAWLAFVRIRRYQHSLEVAADRLAADRRRAACWRGWKDALAVQRRERTFETTADALRRAALLQRSWRRLLSWAALGRTRTAAVARLLYLRWRQEARLAFGGWRSIAALRRKGRRAADARRLAVLRSSFGFWSSALPPRKRHLARVAAAACRLESRWRTQLVQDAFRALAKHGLLRRVKVAVIAEWRARTLCRVFPCWRAVAAHWREDRLGIEAVQHMQAGRILREALFSWRVELARGVQLLQLRNRIQDRGLRAAAAACLLAWRYYRERNVRVRAFVIARARSFWGQSFYSWRIWARSRGIRNRCVAGALERRSLRAKSSSFAAWRLFVAGRAHKKAIARAFAARYAAARATAGDRRLQFAARRWRAWPLPAAFDSMRAYALRRIEKRGKLAAAVEHFGRRLAHAALVGWRDVVTARHSARASDAYWALQRKGYWLRRWRKTAEWRARRKREYTAAMLFWAQHSARRMLRGWRDAVLRSADLQARLEAVTEAAAVRAIAASFAQWRTRLAKRREERLAVVRAAVHADYATVRRCMSAWVEALADRRAKLAYLAHRLQEARHARLRELLFEWRSAARKIHRLRTQGGELRRRTLKRKRDLCFSVWRQWAARHKYCRRAVAIFQREKVAALVWQAWRTYAGLARWTRQSEAAATESLSSRLARRCFSAWRKRLRDKRNLRAKEELLARRTTLLAMSRALRWWRVYSKARVLRRACADALLARHLVPRAWREWRRRTLHRRAAATACAAIAARWQRTELSAVLLGWLRVVAKRRANADLVGAHRRLLQGRRLQAAWRAWRLFLLARRAKALNQRVADAHRRSRALGGPFRAWYDLTATQVERAARVGEIAENLRRRGAWSLAAVCFLSWRHETMRSASLRGRQRTLERAIRERRQAVVLRHWATRLHMRAAKRDMLVRTIAWLARSRADRVLRHWCAWAQHAAAQRRAVRQQVSRRMAHAASEALEALRMYAARRRRKKRATAIARQRRLQLALSGWARHHAMHLLVTFVVATRDALRTEAFGRLRDYALRRREKRVADAVARLHFGHRVLRIALAAFRRHARTSSRARLLLATSRARLLSIIMREWSAHAAHSGNIRYAYRRLTAARQLRCMTGPFAAWRSYAAGRSFWRHRLADASARIAEGALRRALGALWEFTRGARATRESIMRRERADAALAHALARARARVLKAALLALRIAAADRRRLRSCAAAVADRRNVRLAAEALGAWQGAAADRAHLRKAAERMGMRFRWAAAAECLSAWAAVTRVRAAARERLVALGARVRSAALAAAFGAWRRRVSVLRVGRAADSLRRQRALASAFEAWADVAREERAKRFEGARLRRTLGLAFGAWAFFTAYRRRLAAGLETAIATRETRARRAAFNEWRSRSAREARRRESGERAARHLARNRCRSVLRTFSAVLQERRERRERAMRTAAQRRASRSLRSCLREWRLAASSLATRRETLDVAARRMALRGRLRTLGGCLIAWRDRAQREATAGRLAELRRARVAAGVVRAWREACVERREGRRRVVAAREYRLRRLGRVAFAALRAAARAANWQRGLAAPAAAPRAAPEQQPQIRTAVRPRARARGEDQASLELSPIALHEQSSEAESSEPSPKPLGPLSAAARLATDFLASATVRPQPAPGSALRPPLWGTPLRDFLRAKGCLGEPLVFVDQSIVEPQFSELTIIFEWVRQAFGLGLAKEFFRPDNPEVDEVLPSTLLADSSSRSFAFFEKPALKGDNVEEELRKRMHALDAQRTAQLTRALRDADGLTSRLTGLLKHLNSVTLPPQFTGGQALIGDANNRLVLYVEKGTATRIKLSLEEKQVPYAVYVVDLEQNMTDVKAMNARGLLPILKDGDVIVHETAAILEYIEMTFPQNQMLFFADRTMRARALTRFHETQAFALETMEFLTYVSSEPDEGRARQIAQSSPLAERFRENLAMYEKYLTGSGGQDPEYVAGDKLTLGDFGLYVCIAAATTMLPRLGIDFNEQFPRIFRHYQRISKRQSVQKITSESS